MARQSPNDSVSVFCTLYSIFWTLYSVFSTLNSVFCTRNFVFCTLNFVFCTLNFMFCTLIPVLRVWQSDGWAVKLPQGRLRWLWLICYNNNIHSSLNSEHGTVGNLGGHLFLCKFIYWEMWTYSLFTYSFFDFSYCALWPVISNIWENWKVSYDSLTPIFSHHVV